MNVWVSLTHTRAAPGGMGAVKCASNYAANLLPQAEAFANGCEQVLFLDAFERRWIEELGSMNVFFVRRDGSLVTPPLTGTILAGITRQSIIELARAQGRVVEEQPYAFEQFRADVGSGAVVEAFVCGTAAVVVPIGEVRFADGAFRVGAGAAGPITSALRNKLLRIQHGEDEDQFGWLHRIRPGRT